MSASKVVTLSATGNTQIANAGEAAGPDGWMLTFVGIGWTGSIVLKSNTGAPQAVTLTNVAYQNGNTFAPIASGTAITVATVPYIVQQTGYDLWLAYTHTAGTVTVIVTPANNASGGSGAGPIAAGDVTSGTFGSFTGDAGTYTFVGSIVAGTVISQTSASFSSLSILSATAGEHANGLNIKGASSSTNVTVVAGDGATAALKLVLGYFDGTTNRSALEVANVASGFGTLALMKSGGSVTINDGATGAASAFYIKGSAYGAATAAIRIDGHTSGAAAGVGTLTNAPASTNPNFWLPINIAGTVRYIPCW